MLKSDWLKNEMREKMPVASVSTPFTKNGEVDYRGIRSIVDFIIEAGTGLVLLTYGDSLYSILSDYEIAEVTRAVVEQTRKRAVVVAATGTWWTGKCVEFAEYSQDLGVDVLMSLPPNWADSSNIKTLKQHYTAISEKMPVMIVTALGNKPVPIQVIQELVKENNGIIAIKDDICGAYGRKMASLAHEKWAILSGGLKENHIDIMPYGVDSYLSVYMRFKPWIAHIYWDKIKRSDIPAAVDIIERYERPFWEMVNRVGMDFDSIIHACMEICGICGRWRRLPYQNLAEDQMEIVADFLDKLEVKKDA